MLCYTCEAIVLSGLTLMSAPLLSGLRNKGPLFSYADVVRTSLHITELYNSIVNSSGHVGHSP